jgi:hypothetical protein
MKKAAQVRGMREGTAARAPSSQPLGSAGAEASHLSDQLDHGDLMRPGAVGVNMSSEGGNGRGNASTMRPDNVSTVS